VLGKKNTIHAGLLLELNLGDNKPALQTITLSSSALYSLPAIDVKLVVINGTKRVSEHKSIMTSVFVDG